ncbi:MAG: hypothetical protein M1829_006943 [Trizodia sp. TS-e1964]|nr:MAG: hypothetical protein M1829_006943 [Trizodia sp. TS-e1964]
MRLSCRLFAQAKAIRTIEPYAPTGLTGLTTHPSPRSTLIFLYSSTLEKLKVLPEQSVYRQSAEAITRNRLKIVESIAPAGLEEWTLQASQLLKETPEAFQLAKGRNGETRKFHNINGETFMESRSAAEPDDQNDEWEEESIELLKLENLKRLGQRTDLTPEPQLDANQ